MNKESRIRPRVTKNKKSNFSLHNSLFIFHNSSPGFSLIEMLVVIVLFSMLAYLVTQSTLQSFKGVRKSDAQSLVRDNLNFAANVIERNVRNAKAITSACAGAPAQVITYLDQNNITGSFSCQGASGSQYLASGSGNIRVTSDEVLLTACSFICAQSGINPPVVNVVFTGRENVSEGTEQSLTTVTRQVVLRVY